jgi:hypothetical protein
MAKVGQYRRICRTCGRTWFSLVSRERELANQSGTCCGCNCNPPAMHATAGVELARLKACPSCGSSAYAETIEYAR